MDWEDYAAAGVISVHLLILAAHTKVQHISSLIIFSNVWCLSKTLLDDNSVSDSRSENCMFKSSQGQNVLTSLTSQAAASSIKLVTWSLDSNSQESSVKKARWWVNMVLAEAQKRSEVWINNPVHSDHECQCGSQYGPKVATDTQQQDMSNVWLWPPKPTNLLYQYLFIHYITLFMLIWVQHLMGLLSDFGLITNCMFLQDQVASRYRYVCGVWLLWLVLNKVCVLSDQFAREACRVNGLCCCSQWEAPPFWSLSLRAFVKDMTTCSFRNTFQLTWMFVWL